MLFLRVRNIFNTNILFLKLVLLQGEVESSSIAVASGHEFLAIFWENKFSEIRTEGCNIIESSVSVELNL